MPPVIIGLCGAAGSGKSEVAKYLCEHHGFEELAFATPLKKACSALFDIDLSRFNDQEQKQVMDPRWKVTPRMIMQSVGTMIRDHMAQAIPHLNLSEDRRFFTHLFETYMEDVDDNSKFVISDVRFADEANAILKLGGEIYCIENPQIESRDSHESEQFFKYRNCHSYISGVIYNYGDNLDDLHLAIGDALNL
ncbi:MAG: AAA family ATPase [Gammaproteobacteria bacterium]|nr:AAA family ATPase [Gammaproteobacteria bacterium]